jgi:hypothetical protein
MWLGKARTRSEGQSKYVREKRRCVEPRKESYGMVESKLLCFRWLSCFLKLMRRGVRDLLNVCLSSLFILCECIVSLSRKNFVWSWLMVCYDTVDLSVCATLIYTLVIYVVLIYTIGI